MDKNIKRDLSLLYEYADNPQKVRELTSRIIDGFDNAETETISVETKLGKLIASKSTDPNHPGIYIDLRRNGISYDAPLILTEYADDEAPGDTVDPKIVARCWDDVQREDYTTAITFLHINEYFAKKNNDSNN